MIKYLGNSLAATGADFTTFHMLVFSMQMEAVKATMLGNMAGAGVSFTLLQWWVFRGVSQDHIARKIVKFAVGVGICIISNMILVAIFNHLMGWTPWPSRITAAVGAWALGYWYNARVVFKP